MFCDYYSILEIEDNASLAEIKLAFRRQALKWHPDRNTEKDTTNEMRLINEAYLILKDEEARARYDLQYKKYKDFLKTNNASQDAEQEDDQPFDTQPSPEADTTGFSVDDDILRRWMDNARKQAIELAKQSLEDFKGMAKAGAIAAVKEGGTQLLGQILIALVAIVLISIFRACN